MRTITFASLPQSDRALLREAAERLSRSLNKVSNPQISAIALTKKGRYFGNNIFLSNCTLLCAEASAMAATVAAVDSDVIKLYLAIGRSDLEAPPLILPCGNCRQMLHDFSRLGNNIIEVFSSTASLKEVIVTDSAELLPEGFKSISLGKMASRPRR
jgi:cytidine deaminase